MVSGTWQADWSVEPSVESRGAATPPLPRSTSSLGRRLPQSLRQHRASIIPHIHANPLHLVEASYSRDRLKAAQHHPDGEGYAGSCIWTSENAYSTHSGE